MSKVRAKFFVKQIINHHNGDPKADQAGEVVLGPVYDDLAALAAFELGGKYYVDFSPA